MEFPLFLCSSSKVLLTFRKIMIFPERNGGLQMKRLITLLIVSLSTILLIACSNQASNSLDGEYYWINESRNEVAFTISGNKGNINKGGLILLQLIKIVQQSN